MTEAERIEQSIIDFLLGSGSYDGYWWGDEIQDKRPPFWWRTKLKAENERLQQQLKEKDDRIAKLTLFSRIDQTDIEFLKEELKSARELNRELVGIAKLYISLKKQILDYLPNDDEAKVELEEIEDIINKSLATKEDTTDKSNYSSDLQ